MEPFNLPLNLVDDPETQFYTNLDTGATFCYTEEQFCFIDLPPNQSLPKDCHTNLETADKLCAEEEPFDVVDNVIAAMETVPKQCHINLQTGDKSCLKEETFDLVDNATAAKETVPKKEDLPLRLDAGNGPRIHRQLCIEAGVVNKRCEECGQVGQLTCFSPGYRKWALRRVTKEELNQICSRCHERGHNCLNCDIPITSRLVEVPVPQEKKTLNCGRCGEAGHTQRFCPRAV